MTEIKSNRAGSSSNTATLSPSPPPCRAGGAKTAETQATPIGDELVLLATVEARVPPARQPDVMRVVRNFCQAIEPHVTSLLEVLPELRPRTVFDLSGTANRLLAPPEPSHRPGAEADFDVRYAPEGSYTLDEVDAVLSAAAEVYGAELDTLKARLGSGGTAGRGPGRVRVVIDLSRLVIEEEHALEVTLLDEPSPRPTRTAPPAPVRAPRNGQAAQGGGTSTYSSVTTSSAPLP